MKAKIFLYNKEGYFFLWVKNTITKTHKTNKGYSKGYSLFEYIN